jgi:hypothetical protein
VERLRYMKIYGFAVLGSKVISRVGQKAENRAEAPNFDEKRRKKGGKSREKGL